MMMMMMMMMTKVWLIFKRPKLPITVSSFSAIRRFVRMTTVCLIFFKQLLL